MLGIDLENILNFHDELKFLVTLCLSNYRFANEYSSCYKYSRRGRKNERIVPKFGQNLFKVAFDFLDYYSTLKAG